MAGGRSASTARRPTPASPAAPGTPGTPRTARSTTRAAHRWEKPDAATWMLVPLRAFLGLTFVYAGLQKFADRWFFKSSAPASITAQLHAASHHSPIGWLAGGLAHASILVGLLIALAEVAIGAATVLGLWARWAAGAGLVLSLGFLLLVSWHTRPYYYGADVVFVFAWTPLVIAGAGTWSLDARAATEARRDLNVPAVSDVTIGFDTVQRLCGAFDRGRCRAQDGRRCRPAGCPVLERRTPTPVQQEIDRRTFLERAGMATWLGAASLFAGGAFAVLGRVVPPRKSGSTSVTTLGETAGGASTTSVPPTTAAPGQAPTTAAPGPATTAATTAPPATAPPATQAPQPAAPQTTPPTTPAAAPVGTAIGPASAVPVGGAARFTDPKTGDPAYVLQPSAGRFVAFDATCTHQGCPVEYAGSLFQCPCHGAEFSVHSGAVLRGPATSPLSPIRVQEGPGGTLYVD